MSEKNELLIRHGINFSDTPQWQRRGVGLYWEHYEKVEIDPVRQVEVTASRWRVKVDRELPMMDEYGALVAHLLGADSRGAAVIPESTTSSASDSRSPR